ncbi:MAG: Glycosyl transferase family 2 [Microgenomates group bacterium GW2011_GWC1_39_7b]|uniref:Glycosyl transferase family 2 n=2 Tax=Candidatus Woeseibacteriota TaxID=1752722 RepID=A0A0G0LUP2_9BACT|nr:MAG: Glycosyl transferase family 2 [Candidatus Woesebacteria bacterium GW2011_GWB1_39_10]KKR26900.1 MAG: Glycosyl transferase family 2 [Microgenomates group bacterium GW2011_GWC1_39_7b]KKS90707.1 MAG: Glycosyl transferase family 2 [Candidatus Woesebacteria bacterium GW2011_GWA1_43_12]
MKNFTTAILNKKNITDFAASRNKLLKKSKADWVLFLDKDETILKEFKIETSDDFSCYQFIRKNYFLGQYFGNDKIIRLVKKGTGKWARCVHEVWKPSTGRVGMIDTPIIHNTADNLHEYISKINFYSDLHAKANIEEGKRPTLLKIIFFPFGKFLITFFKTRNIVFSIMQSLHSFLSWSKQWIIQNA